MRRPYDLSVTPEALDAARRLAHDVGKYVRFGAPEEPERDVAQLRERLSRDLCATRLSDAGSETVLEVYESWRREKGDAVAREALLAPHLTAASEALAAIASLLPRLDVLEEPELRALDDAALDLSRRCFALARAARSAVR
jgi:hypothetical protein